MSKKPSEIPETNQNKWSKYFRLSQMTNLGTNLAAIITAVVAFFTLIQIKKQTEYSYRPDLMVQETNEYMHLKFEKEIEDVYDFQWNLKQLIDSLDTQIDQIYQIEIVNIGLAAAKEIELDWEFDVDRMTGTINFTNTQLDTKSQNIPDDSRSQLFISNSLNSLPKSFNFGHILPINQSNSKNQIDLFPHYYLLWANVLTRLCNLNLSHEEKNKTLVEFIESCPPLELKLSYLDIGQKKYQKTYTIKLIPRELDLVNRYIKVRIFCYEKGHVANENQSLQSVSINNAPDTPTKIMSIEI